MARVVLAMSGGVDSSVAAALLQEAGHEVIGLFMRHGQQSDAACRLDAPAGGTSARPLPQLPVISELSHKQGCCTAQDAHDARRVADKLGITFYSLNFEEEFTRIIDYFVDEYTAGRTPNPCVVCNAWLKFGRLADYAQSVDAEYIATGHYAQLKPAVAEPNGLAPAQPGLFRGLDPGKDQSYALFGINRQILPRLMFPVGGFQKSEIRERARGLGLRVAEKKDSQEICFVTTGHYGDFVRARRGGRLDLSGEIVTTAGEVVGRHDGLENFTVGQRKGLGVAFGEPRYVIRLETESRRVVIGERSEIERTTFTAAQANWLIDSPAADFRCQVKIRYLGEPVDAVVSPLAEDRFTVAMDEPRGAVTPGQAVVCYQGDRVLGGGWIE